MKAAWAVQCLISCAPLDGEIFVSGREPSAEEGSDSSGPGNSISSGDGNSAMCESQALIIEGNDAAWMHGCGEPCDSDWCSCTPCTSLSGPLGVVAPGIHRLTIVGGASGPIEFSLQLTTNAETIHSEDFDYDGLFEHEIMVAVPEGCEPIELEIIQKDDRCARIYEILLDSS